MITSKKVCQGDHRKTTGRIFIKFGGRIYPWLRKYGSESQDKCPQFTLLMGTGEQTMFSYGM